MIKTKHHSLSFKRPRIPKPKIPKIKKPSTKIRRKLNKNIKKEIKKSTTVSPPKKKVLSLTSKPKTLKKNSSKNFGVCFAAKSCKGKVISKKCTKFECKKMGGKSWKGKNGCQEIV